MECSAKKGGDEVIGEEGLFGRVVDKVCIPFHSRGIETVLILIFDIYRRQILETPALYTKSSVGIGGKVNGPPGTYPGGKVDLEQDVSAARWCAC